MRVLLLTGPGGSGKSTIAKLLEEFYNFAYLDGDHEDTEFFPEGKQWFPENASLLKKAHDKILQKTKQLVYKGKRVVIDYIIFDDYINFIESFRNEFGSDFSVIVLFPSNEELIKRDAERECWTTGKDRINVVYSEFEDLRVMIDSECYLDTTGMTPEATLDTIVSTIS